MSRRLDPYAAIFASEEAVSTEIDPGLHDALVWMLDDSIFNCFGSLTS